MRSTARHSAPLLVAAVLVLTVSICCTVQCMYYAPVSIDYLLLYVQGTLFINCKSQHWDSED